MLHLMAWKDRRKETFRGGIRWAVGPEMQMRSQNEELDGVTHVLFNIPAAVVSRFLENVSRTPIREGFGSADPAIDIGDTKFAIFDTCCFLAYDQGKVPKS